LKNAVHIGHSTNGDQHISISEIEQYTSRTPAIHEAILANREAPARWGQAPVDLVDVSAERAN